MPVLGPLLRGAVAFYIRRSFRGNALYTTVFKEYLYSILSRNTPIEYFIEGGRSRTGRLLPPKTGMLAMTVQALLRGIDRARNRDHRHASVLGHLAQRDSVAVTAEGGVRVDGVGRLHGGGV